MGRIGVGTNFKELWEGAVSSGVVKLYLVTNIIDILLALGLAYLVFKKKKNLPFNSMLVAGSAASESVKFLSP
jgi:hypothetical protein